MVMAPFLLGASLTPNRAVADTEAMRNVYVIGTACTPFGKHETKSFPDLARWACADLRPNYGLDAQQIKQAG